MQVMVTFVYEPEDPDLDDVTGMHEDEYEELERGVEALRGMDMKVEARA